MWIAVGCCAALVVIGLITLWPGSSTSSVDPLGLDGEPVRAEVVSVEVAPCSYDVLLGCRTIEIVPSEGPEAGERLTFEQGLDSPIRNGDSILVDIGVADDGALMILFAAYQRSTPLLLLTLLFAAAIVVLGRWKGVGALAGLAASLMVIIAFVLPAVLEGSHAVLVALVAAGAIAFLALFLAHGVNLATAAALLSSIASLAVTAVLAWLFVQLSNLTGLANESIGFLGALGTDINPEGLLLAGVVIGSLGVLDDVTVTQVSAVWELKREALERLCAVPLPPGRQAAYEDFTAAHGQALTDHATWAALTERHGLHLEPGRLVLEIRPPGVDKGVALIDYVQETDARAVLYAGDDLGDLAAYDAVDRLRGEGVPGLLVCSGDEVPELASRADLVVPGPGQVAALLAAIAETLRRAR